MTGFRYEWDETKRIANRAKHGLDFGDVTHFEWRGAEVFPDPRKDYDAQRFVAYGRFAGRLCAVVFTDRGPIRRIISFRKANRREQAAYYARSRR